MVLPSASLSFYFFLYIYFSPSVLLGWKGEEKAGAAGEEEGATTTSGWGDELTEGGKGQPHESDTGPDPGQSGEAGSWGLVCTCVVHKYSVVQFTRKHQWAVFCSVLAVKKHGLTSFWSSCPLILSYIRGHIGNNLLVLTYADHTYTPVSYTHLTLPTTASV